jgi:RNA polymerase II subunit A small phosphatase-like protein
VKRPFVDYFIDKLGPLYELVVFTASVPQYAEPLLELLDPKRLIKHRLYRDSCTSFNGMFIKDLSRLGREVEKACLIDNSLSCGYFHPQNTIGIGSWFRLVILLVV